MALLFTMAGVWGASRMLQEVRSWLLLQQAEESYSHHRYSTALRVAFEELKVKPGDRRGSLVAARCLTRLRRAADAEPYYRAAGPLELDDLQARALALFESNQADAAAKVYEEALRRWPDDPILLRRLGAVRIAQSRWEDALALADRLIQAPGAELVGQTFKGSVCDYMGLYGQAITADERVLQLDPELRSIPLPVQSFWTQFAHSLLAEGRTQEVLNYLGGASRAGNDPALLELLGKAYQKQGRIDLAETCWRRAMEADSSRSDPWLELGRVALQRKQFKEAVRLLTRASELSPSALDPIYSLSQAHRLMGHAAEADRLQKRLFRLRRESQNATPGPGP